ncbi:MAG: homoserine dehydrogenase [Rickettsiales bacterium]|jgi:homoserine dehydrogenase|nr:homoserine dehydrogenase [Rickettsiales bacterium]
MTSLRLGIAGLGTVGIGLCDILLKKADFITERAGLPITVSAVSARDKTKNRGLDFSKIAWEDKPEALASRADIDVVVELMGGEGGSAYALCKQALQNGKHVVTANKAMIAHHGVELAELAEKHNVSLAFEASVAGGIPILKGLKEGLAANRFSHIVGILNGTCNYILTQMERTGKDFGEILDAAQKAGYAEADPSFDIDGIDTAHKLSILAAVAYGNKVSFQDVYIEGIRHVTLDDIRYARELGFAIKLLGICRKTAHGIEQRVHPALVPESHPIATVNDVYNAVIAECDSAGSAIFEGRGAGAGPTASAVVADLMDIARNRTSFPFNVPVAKLKSEPTASMDTLQNAYYIRLHVVDAPGVLAEITRIFRDNAISMKTLLQKAPNSDNHVQVVVTTHITTERGMMQAVKAIESLETVLESPHVMRIETMAEA